MDIPYRKKRKEIKLDAIVNIAGVHLMASLVETDPQKMKKLLDAGAITQEEYDAVKAKISIKAKPQDKEDDENTEADIVVNGTLTPVYVKILGWTINNYNTEGYLVKKIDATATPFKGWNNTNDFRSYWAWDTNYDYEGSTTITTLEGHNAALATKSFAQAIEVSEDGDDKNRESVYDYMYCYEHAKAQGQDNVKEDRSAAVAYPNVTTVLVAGQILLSKDATTTETLYKYNGIYYT